MEVGKLLNGLCVVYGYCLPPDAQQRIIADPPQTIDAFTDAVIIAEGLDPVRMDTDRRRELRRMVAAAFGEQISRSHPEGESPGPNGVIATDIRSSATPERASLRQ